MKRIHLWWSAGMGLILVAGLWVGLGPSQTQAQSKTAYKETVGT